MGDLVCDGTEFSCPFCTSKLKLKVLSSSATGDGKKIANMSNSMFPPPGGNCTVVPSAPVPCTPAATPIDQGQKNVQVDNVPALGADCKFQCAKGGLLTVSSPGQSKGKHDEATGGGIAAMIAAGSPIFTGPKKIAKENRPPAANDPYYDPSEANRSENKPKPKHLPATKKVKVDMEHITSGHTKGGDRMLQSKKKSAFPNSLNEKQIERNIKEAYKMGKKVKTQGDRVKVIGKSKEGMEIEMWVNTKAKTIETAYPANTSFKMSSYGT